MAIINKETIISTFDDKMTLLQFLKNIEKVLVKGILKSVKVVRVDSGHIKIVFAFEDGTTQETNSIVLGEADLSTLATLIKGREGIVVNINENNTALELQIGADKMKKINNALQLPAARPNEQKLVGIDTSNAQNLLGLGEGLQIENDKIKVGGTITDAEVIENMNNYTINYLGDSTTTDFTNNINYVGICKNGNKLTFVISGEITKLNSSSPSNIDFCSILIPSSISQKLINNSFGYVSNSIISLFDTYYSFKSCALIIQKFNYNEQQKILRFRVYNLDTLTINTPYSYRIEVTFLLSDNLASN